MKIEVIIKELIAQVSNEHKIGFELVTPWC